MSVMHTAAKSKILPCFVTVRNENTKIPISTNVPLIDITNYDNKNNNDLQRNRNELNIIRPNFGLKTVSGTPIFSFTSHSFTFRTRKLFAELIPDRRPRLSFWPVRFCKNTFLWLLVLKIGRKSLSFVAFNLESDLTPICILRFNEDTLRNSEKYHRNSSEKLQVFNYQDLFQHTSKL